MAIKTARVVLLVVVDVVVCDISGCNIMILNGHLRLFIMATYYFLTVVNSNHIPMFMQFPCIHDKSQTRHINNSTFLPLSTWLSQSQKLLTKQLVVNQCIGFNIKHLNSGTYLTYVGLNGNNDQSAGHVCFYRVHREC